MTAETFPTDQVVAAYDLGLQRMVLENPNAGTIVSAAANLLINGSVSRPLWDRLQGHIMDESNRIAQSNQDSSDAIVLREALGRHLLDPSTGSLQTRNVGPYIAAHFPLRGLKPLRTGNDEINELFMPFDDTAFHYDKVTDEVFTTFTFGGYEVSMLPNKFPFTANHTLVVPNIHSKIPQYLTPEFHKFAHAFVNAAPEGSVLGFNARGGYSSVNQLHFHLLLQYGLLPFDVWSMPYDYPAKHQQFTSPNATEEAGSYIAELNRSAKESYNVIYTHDKIIVFTRPYQDPKGLPQWTAGFGYHELGGTINTSSPHALYGLSVLAINNAMRNP